MIERRFRWAAYLLGFGLGGFFDGILLHQILQWHHLLSGLRNGVLADLRAQVLADGIFHALMYVVAAVGLWLLVRSRDRLARPGAPMLFMACLLIGFGLWHAVDAVLSHWITGIHRIRGDVDNPLFWDLLWLVVFGLVPLALGLLLRGRSGSSGDTPAVATAVPLLLAGATVIAGLVAARPVADAGGTSVTVVMRPGADPGRLLVALAGTDTRIVWADAAAGVVVLEPDRAASRWPLYRDGALYVSGTMLPDGCSAWLRAAGGRRVAGSA